MNRLPNPDSTTIYLSFPTLPLKKSTNYDLYYLGNTTIFTRQERERDTKTLLKRPFGDIKQTWSDHPTSSIYVSCSPSWPILLPRLILFSIKTKYYGDFHETKEREIYYIKATGCFDCVDYMKNLVCTRVDYMKTPWIPLTEWRPKRSSSNPSWNATEMTCWPNLACYLRCALLENRLTTLWQPELLQ